MVTSGGGVGNRVLAEALGARIAWWQLGFSTRRVVLRTARRGVRFPDPDVWEVAVDWARRQLGAPRWWRVVRDVGAAALVVVCLAALAVVLADVDGPVAAGGTALACSPLAAWWSTRQSGGAAAVLRLCRDRDGHRPRTPGSAVRATAALVAAGAAAVALVVADADDRAVRPDCPSYALDAPVREWWARGRSGCPAGDSRTGPTGVRHTPWALPEQPTTRPLGDIAYVAPGAGVLLLPSPIFQAWVDGGGPGGPLGEPTDSGDTGLLHYANFRGGSVVLPTGGAAEVHIGQKFAGTRDLDTPCAPLDRPCVTSARAEGGRVRVGWRYGSADAFNVAWWPQDEPWLITGREAAGYGLTLAGLRPATTYLVEVSACHKRFLRRSACTWPSARVAVRVG